MSDSVTSRNNSSDDYPIIHNTYDNPQMGELESLIQIIQDKIQTDDPQIKCVKYPNLLITSLIELNHLVGMERLKDSIALQVMRLIDGANNGEKSTKMLNTILYGPPGVGKTKVGIILAKIWCALGYLKKPANIKVNLGNTAPGIPGTTTINNTSGGGDINPFVFIVLLLLFYGFTYIISGISFVYNTVGALWLLFIVIMTVLIVMFLYWNSKTYTYITNIVKVPIQGQQDETNIDDKKLDQIQDRDIITVVSRQDFVADYVGQTATKTKALLYSNLGKVIFIDEAYSLINGERDPFGMEALTTLNLFMSEHADSIAVIFAGYKDIMKHGIFRIQPGLPRRCMWHFECTGYDGNQLVDIFLRQVYTEGWAIRKSDYGRIRQLICDNEDMFKSYGGDTERLLFFSQLEASRTNMMRSTRSSCSNSSTRSNNSTRSNGSNNSTRSNNSNNSTRSNNSNNSTRSNGSTNSTRSNGSTNSTNSSTNTCLMDSTYDDTRDNTYDTRDNTYDTNTRDNTRDNTYDNTRDNTYDNTRDTDSHHYKTTDSDMGERQMAGKILTYEHVQHGLRRLEENNIASN